MLKINVVQSPIKPKGYINVLKNDTEVHNIILLSGSNTNCILSTELDDVPF